MDASSDTSHEGTPRSSATTSGRRTPNGASTFRSTSEPQSDPYNPLKLLKTVFKPMMRAATDSGFSRHSVPATVSDGLNGAAENQHHLGAAGATKAPPIPTLSLPAQQLPLNLPLRSMTKSGEISSFFQLPEGEHLVGKSNPCFCCCASKAAPIRESGFPRQCVWTGSLKTYSHSQMAGFQRNPNSR